MGKETEFIDVTMGIGRNIVFTMHVSSFLGRPNKGIQGKERSIIKSLLKKAKSYKVTTQKDISDEGTVVPKHLNFYNILSTHWKLLL